PLSTVMCKRWFCGLGIAIFNTIFFGANCARAQITPDRTLPNNSIVTPNGSTINITGGTQAGGNLFHSFREFSVPTRGTAFFNNGVDIQNIISRVTGGSISNIDGVIGANGKANVFLINPNGIIFGPNASLNVGGSFIGSTAKSINFADGTIFSSTPTESAALLTVSVPLGLQFGSNPGEIKVLGPGYDFSYDTVIQETRSPLETNVPGLAVNPGQTLALVGGKVSVSGGVLSSPTGRIEIGSVDSLQSVNLVPVQHGWKLRYPDASSLGDIQISDKSFVSTTGVGGGSIAIIGKNINLNGQSILVGDTLGDRDGGTTKISVENIVVTESLISSNTSGSGSGGKNELDANNITFQNQGSVVVQTQGKGDGGTINLLGKNSLKIESGSLASSAQANSTGNAGDVNVNVTGLIEARNVGITTKTLGAGGNAGNIKITGNSLVLENAGISASTTNTGIGGEINIHIADSLKVDSAGITTDTSGTGDGGKINITANSFQVKGVGISSNARVNSTGKAGEINIDAGSIKIGLGGALNTNTSGKGDAGTINIHANSFLLEGGVINSKTEENSTGKAGDITVNVAGPLTIDTAGGINAYTSGTGDAGKINITANSFRVASAGINSTTYENSIGNAGNIKVNVAGQLTIDNGNITTNAAGIGNAGKITITTEFLKLDNALNDPSISATSTSGKGGNIDLKIGNLLLLRHQGSISTTAGTPGTGGDGGNITINAPNGFIVAIKSENSDITANAFTGRGGIITINASGLYGIEPRPQLTPLSDITAFSQSGISGDISINRPDVQQHLELAKLPKVFADISLLDRSCSAIASTVSDRDSNTQQSQFIVTGRGGLPPNPYDPLSGDVVWSDTRLPNISEQQQRLEKPKAKPPSKGKVVEINPATGWVFNGNGDVTLISQKDMSNGLQSTPTTCPQQWTGGWR
ncbi:MAG: filamentous hemagglutinin N-terminal domain-containing protein, partial [Stigonema ocellatum SAG 48.90 = DSM 106950]|nr:filamentous hemagglutinin N-terminal domain-containing protein [Stigonema ocellatum SAG 48.90 = DSM 106950]